MIGCNEVGFIPGDGVHSPVHTKNLGGWIMSRILISILIYHCGELPGEGGLCRLRFPCFVFYVFSDAPNLCTEKCSFFNFQFHNSDDAKKALEQLNGFELAGRPMKVGNVTERSDSAQGPSILDSDELDRTGIDLGATGRLQLMFKLAEGEFGKGIKYMDSTVD